jgi:hypothetical protein
LDPLIRETETQDVQVPVFTRKNPRVLYLILTRPSREESIASCLMKISPCTVRPSFRFVFLTSHSMRTCLETRTSENNDLQMTTMCWPLTHVRLEGGRLLLEIISFCSENTLSDGSDDGLDGVKKNPYRFNVRRKLLRSDNCTTTKIQRKTSLEKIRKVNSMRCCVEKCCQTFDWENTVRIRRKFHSGSFSAKCETGYSVLGQLHDLLGKRKKFITLGNRDVCENAWFIIHGLSRSAFFIYKFAAKAGSVSGCHGNLGVLRPDAHTIRAEANMMTIINKTADRMPNSTREIGKKRMDNLKILPSTCNWDHI